MAVMPVTSGEGAGCGGGGGWGGAALHLAVTEGCWEPQGARALAWRQPWPQFLCGGRPSSVATLMDTRCEGRCFSSCGDLMSLPLLGLLFQLQVSPEWETDPAFYQLSQEIVSKI